MGNAAMAAAKTIDELRHELSARGQEHVLRWWHALSEPAQTDLRRQLEHIDFDQLGRVMACRQQGGASAQDSESKTSADARARRAASPSSLVRLPRTSDDRDRWEHARRVGDEMLSAGKVGAILVAGGQGTRLGFDKPKGVFSLGPVSGASLFQILAEQLLARSRRAGRSIPYFVMTSDATHAQTIEYFVEHNSFGLPASDIFFFSQGNMPAVDAATGRLLMADRQTISVSPDGHGGLVQALAKAGLLEEMSRRGIEFLHYHQVDNPTAIVCDPVFLGFHAITEAEMSVKVVAKRSAEERMGVVVDVDGQTQIIEYSDLPAEVARQVDGQGNLLLWAGSTAIHVFNRAFLERVTNESGGLPFHVARKKVSYVDDGGTLVAPAAENAYKFERFIFDALPSARRALVLETDRRREFNPVKNASGDDSPETSREALLHLHRSWLTAAGAAVDESVTVEISPLFALDADEVRTKVKVGAAFTAPTYLSSQDNGR